MMKTGIDLVEISRIQQSLKNPRFLTRVFSENEIRLFENSGHATQSFAANFAAKEAFSKSLGTGIRGFKLTEVEILRDEYGAPILQLYGQAKEKAKGLLFTISLTHTEHYASAIVIAYD